MRRTWWLVGPAAPTALWLWCCAKPPPQGGSLAPPQPHSFGGRPCPQGHLPLNPWRLPTVQVLQRSLGSLSASRRLLHHPSRGEPSEACGSKTSTRATRASSLVRLSPELSQGGGADYLPFTLRSFLSGGKTFPCTGAAVRRRVHLHGCGPYGSFGQNGGLNLAVACAAPFPELPADSALRGTGGATGPGATS